jgi:hypothetical protein
LGWRTALIDNFIGNIKEINLHPLWLQGDGCDTQLSIFNLQPQPLASAVNPEEFSSPRPSLGAEIKNPRVLRHAGLSLCSLAACRNNRIGEIYGLSWVGPDVIATAFLRVTSAMTM